MMLNLFKRKENNMKKIVLACTSLLALGACAGDYRDGRHSDGRSDGAFATSINTGSRNDSRYDEGEYMGMDSGYDRRMSAKGWHGGHMEAKARYFFDRMDMNGDGYVTRGEQRSFSDRMFRETDVNRDGRVSFEECLAMKRREWQEWRDTGEYRRM